MGGRCRFARQRLRPHLAGAAAPLQATAFT
jgi:hypothetical protein